MTSILSLPNELLVAAFELVISDSYSQEPHRLRTALALTCRVFYAVVNHTPSLWTTINSRQSASATTLALSRSQNLPLDVWLELVQVSGRRTDEEVLEALSLHMHRWRTAQLTGAYPLRDLTFSRYFSRPAPLLEKLGLTSFYESSDPATKFLAAQADRLTSVWISGMAITWVVGGLHGLQDLELEAISDEPTTFENIIQVLSASPRLFRLSLRSMNALEVYPPNLAKVHLPLLRSLTVIETGGLFMTHLLRHIQSPPCPELVMACELDVNPLAFASALRPFIHTIPPQDPLTTIAVRKQDVDYSIHSDPEYLGRFSIDLQGAPPAVALHHIISILPPQFAERETELLVEGCNNLKLVQALLTMTDTAIRVTSLTLGKDTSHVESILQLLAQPKSNSKQLPFLALRELSFDIGDVTPWALIRMIDARYGIPLNPKAEENEAPGRPVSLTSLSVRGAKSHHDPDCRLVRAVLGMDAVKWEREG